MLINNIKNNNAQVPDENDENGKNSNNDNNHKQLLVKNSKHRPIWP